MGNIRVILVDDHSVVRMGFRMLIDAEPDIEVISEAESGEEGIKVFKDLKPDVVVMDLSLIHI